LAGAYWVIRQYPEPRVMRLAILGLAVALVLFAGTFMLLLPKVQGAVVTARSPVYFIGGTGEGFELQEMLIIGYTRHPVTPCSPFRSILIIFCAAPLRGGAEDSVGNQVNA
jgi:hypothetical protein